MVRMAKFRLKAHVAQRRFWPTAGPQLWHQRSCHASTGAQKAGATKARSVAPSDADMAATCPTAPASHSDAKESV